MYRLIGVAPEATIYSYKVFTQSVSGTASSTKEWHMLTRVTRVELMKLP